MPCAMRIRSVLFALLISSIPVNICVADSILAYVYDYVITLVDAKKLIKLNSYLAGHEYTGNYSKQEIKTALSDLVAHCVKKREIENFRTTQLKQKVFVSDRDVTNSISDLAKQHGLSYGQFISQLNKLGVDEAFARDYWFSNIAWSKYMQYTCPSTMNISDNDVERFINNQEIYNRHREFHITLIQVDAKAGRDVADSLCAKLRTDANPDKVIKSLSPDVSKFVTKEPRTLNNSTTEKGLWTTLCNLQAGDCSSPILEDGKYSIYFVREIKKSAPKETIVSVRIALGLNLEEYEAEELNYIAKNSTTHKEFFAAVKEKLGGKVKISPRRDIALSSIAPEFASFLQQYPAGSVSSLVNSDDGLMVFCIESRREVEIKPNRGQIRESLIEQKLSEFSERKLKEAMRTAYIKYAK